MQCAALPLARNHKQSHKRSLVRSITLDAALLCVTLSNAYSVIASEAPPAASPARAHLSLAGNLIPAEVGLSYSVELVASGGTAPYTFTISSGRLPGGIALGKTSGTVSGTPSAAGTFDFRVHVSDSKGLATSQEFQMTVSSAVVVSVTPAAASVQSAGTAQFTALVTNASNQTVTWSATLGGISAAGLYQAPTVNTKTTATVTATSTADPTKSAAASVTITAIPLTLSGNCSSGSGIELQRAAGCRWRNRALHLHNLIGTTACRTSHQRKQRNCIGHTLVRRHF
jgi:hypothetical protein